jgi:hypothetical protein
MPVSRNVIVFRNIFWFMKKDYEGFRLKRTKIFLPKADDAKINVVSYPITGHGDL